MTELQRRQRQLLLAVEVSADSGAVDFQMLQAVQAESAAPAAQAITQAQRHR